MGLAAIEGDRLRLTACDLERADAIGPWLISADIGERMAQWSWDG